MTLPTARRNQAGIEPRSLLLWLAPIAFLALFYFFPLGTIFRLSFARSQAGALAAIADTLQSRATQSIIGFTIGQAVLSTLLTLIIGLPGAYAFARFEFRGKRWLRALTGIPFVLPTLVVAAAFNALLGPSGWANIILIRLFQLSRPPIEFVNSLGAILIAHVFYNTTIVLRLVGDVWSHLNPKLAAAAQTLGANRWQTWRLVTLPLLAPAVLAASLLVFIFNFTSFGVVLVLGGPAFATMEVEIYNQTVAFFNLPAAAALSLIQLLCTLALTFAYTRLAGKLTRPLPLQAETRQPPKQGALPWGVRIVLAALLLLLVLPLLALAARSFSGLAGVRPGQPGLSPFTLAYYQALFAGQTASLFAVPPLQAVLASLRYAGATVALSLGLGLPAAWALAYRGDGWLNRVMDPLLMLPLGTSAVTLGLGFVVALDSPPLDLRTSPVLIPIAHALVAFPFVVRSLTPSLSSIQPRLRQAAAVLGASPRQVLRHIDLPLVGRALFVAAAFAFTISLGEFGATSLIARPESPTIPVMIFRFLSRPGSLQFGQAMALSTLLMLVTGAGMLAIERARLADVGEF